MIDDREDLLLTLNMINLLKLDNGTLLEAFQGERISVTVITTVLNEAHTAERTRAQCRQYIEIIQV